MHGQKFISKVKIWKTESAPQNHDVNKLLIKMVKMLLQAPETTLKITITSTVKCDTNEE